MRACIRSRESIYVCTLWIGSARFVDVNQEEEVLGFWSAGEVVLMRAARRKVCSNRKFNASQIELQMPLSSQTCRFDVTCVAVCLTEGAPRLAVTCCG